jgi:hypothetical protein
MRPAESVEQDLAGRSTTTSSDTAAKTGTHVVCTHAEGSYFYGLAALANSLVHAGFKGRIVVGYRGRKPLWAEVLKIKDEALQIYEVTPAVDLQFIEVPGTWHLANHKGHLIKQIFHEIVPNADLVYYFDTDIVITHDWTTLAEWARNGVVVALDMTDTYMSPHHVYRRAWQELAAKSNRKCRDFTGYVNSGCVGINRAFAEFAEVWALLMEELEREGADMNKGGDRESRALLRRRTGKLEYARMDQDVCNTTIMATDIPIALLGTEAMGLFPWIGAVMPHAMFHKKPWMRNYIFDALRGFPPNRTYRTYWQFVDGPIRPFSEWEFKRKKTAVAIACLIGLFHTRSFRDL